MSKHASRVYGIFVLVLICGLSLFSPYSLAAQQAKSAAQAQEKAPTIMVLPFQLNSTQLPADVQKEFAGLLIQRLAGKGMQAVRYEAVIDMLEKRKVSVLDINASRELARSVGANYALYGMVSEAGGILSIDARLVPAGGGEPKPIYVEHLLGHENLMPAVEDLASKVVSNFGAKHILAGIEVRGTKVLDPDVILSRVSAKVGEPINQATVDAEIKKIWDLGYFSDVQVAIEQKQNGPVLVYTVQEKPRIESIAVEGSKAIDEDDIIAAMSNKKGSVLNEKLLAEDLQKILEMYRKKGYHNAKVEPRIDSPKNAATASLILSVNEGGKLYIKEVHIEGAEQVSESDLKSEMHLSPRSFISWITGSGVLREDAIERDTGAIGAYYLNHGFLDVNVGAAKIDYEEDGIVVTFPVKEGPRYQLGAVSFAGDVVDTETKLFSLTKLDEMANKKEFFNYSVMQEDARKLTEYYADLGYAYAEINPQMKKTTEGGNIVDVAFQAEKKYKTYVRRVVVEGNTKTRDNVILREMRITDGDQFEGKKLRRSTERLNKLGYFESAETELVPTAKEDEVDLKVKVKEKPTGAIMAGIGYSTFSNFGVSGTIMERNLWGKGYTTSFQAGFSSRRNSYVFSFTNPRWEDSDLSVGVDVYNWRDDYVDYRKNTVGSLLRFAYPLGEYTTFGWGYRIEQYNLYDLNDYASEIIRHYGGDNRLTSVGISRITRDTTDKLRPTNGNIDTIGVEYGGGFLGGDDDFISVTAEHQTYFQLMPDHVLHGRVKGASLFNNGSDEVPIFERYWMGGIDTVRGYKSSSILPVDPKTNELLGGTRMAFANLEYIWTISNEVGVNLVPFFDVGFNIAADNPYEWSDEIKRSYGLEMRWRSPMGDLRFAYGIPIDDNRDGSKAGGRFEFSMGRFF